MAAVRVSVPLLLLNLARPTPGSPLIAPERILAPLPEQSSMAMPPDNAIGPAISKSFVPYRPNVFAFEFTIFTELVTALMPARGSAACK